MTSKTIPSSWTAQPPFGEARSTESALIAEEIALQPTRPDSNASALDSSKPTLPRLTSKLLGPMAIAVFLSVQELEPASRRSPTYLMHYASQGDGSSIPEMTPEAAALREILDIIDRIPPEDLEDGMTYDFGMRIIAVVNRYHELALTTLAESILGGDVPPAMASHALRWLGRMRGPETESSRFRILSRGLQAASPVVRDGAALGLALLGRPEAVPSLRRAVEREPVVGLRDDLEQVARELEQQI